MGGFSGWVAAVNRIAADLRRVGIGVRPAELSYFAYHRRLTDGRFQLAYAAESGGPGPYYELRQLLFSPNLDGRRAVPSPCAGDAPPPRLYAS